MIRRFRQLNATYAQNRDLITIGAYAKGSDPRVDEAIQHWPSILRFLQQDANARFRSRRASRSSRLCSRRRRAA